MESLKELKNLDSIYVEVELIYAPFKSLENRYMSCQRIRFQAKNNQVFYVNVCKKKKKKKVIEHIAQFRQ